MVDLGTEEGSGHTVRAWKGTGCRGGRNENHHARATRGPVSRINNDLFELSLLPPLHDGRTTDWFLLLMCHHITSRTHPSTRLKYQPLNMNPGKPETFRTLDQDLVVAAALISTPFPASNAATQTV